MTIKTRQDKVNMNENTPQSMMGSSVHMFVMIHLGSILLFLILLAVAIPVLTFVFHTMFESYKRRREYRREAAVHRSRQITSLS